MEKYLKPFIRAIKIEPLSPLVASEGERFLLRNESSNGEAMSKKYNSNLIDWEYDNDLNETEQNIDVDK